MSVKRALAAAGTVVGAVGVASLANRALRDPPTTLPRPLPGQGKTYRWRGMDTYYTDLGNPENPSLVLVHGINAAASSNEYLAIAESLAEQYHVLAPDLPGFGRSDRPAVSYTNEHYEAFLADFLADVADEEPVVVASSLSCAYALSAAAETPVSRLVLVTPATETMPGGERSRLRSFLELPVIGELAFNLISSKYSLKYFSADHSFYDPEAYSEDRQTYDYQTTHRTNARFAPAAFVAGYLDSDLDLASAIDELDVPTTLVWGREATTTPLSAGRTLAAEADTRLVVVDYARLLPHDEHPDAFLDAISADLDLDRDRGEGPFDVEHD
jgi:pimeloyl-ACP methyl ester carboxylesterase